LSTRTDAPPPQSRRERRAADRARGASGTRRPATATGRRGSPILWITAAVGIAAIVLVGGVVLLQGGTSAKVDAAGLISPANPTPLALADGRSLGKADAPVTLEVWSDFQCPACGQFAEIVAPPIIRDYVTPGTLRIVYHDAAYQGARASGSYDESVEAGAAARCAAEQDRYWPFHDLLFANQSGENKGAYADARLRAMAAEAGLDVTAWDACRATGEMQAAVRSEMQQASSSGVDATPTMILNGEKIVGLQSAAELSQKIEAAAAAASK